MDALISLFLLKYIVILIAAGLARPAAGRRRIIEAKAPAVAKVSMILHILRMTLFLLKTIAKKLILSLF